MSFPRKGGILVAYIRPFHTQIQKTRSFIYEVQPSGSHHHGLPALRQRRFCRAYGQLPYVGSVKMEGLPLDEAKAVLMDSLTQYLRIPNLSLVITSYGPRKV